MIASGPTTYDGQNYKKGEEIWDLGSFVAVKAKGNQRSYEGLSKDVDKLPRYVDSLTQVTITNSTSKRIPGIN